MCVCSVVVVAALEVPEREAGVRDSSRVGDGSDVDLGVVPVRGRSVELDGEGVENLYLRSM